MSFRFPLLKWILAISVGLAAHPAEADTVYQKTGPFPAAWSPLTASTPLPVSASAGTTVSLPFEFRFFDSRYSSVSVSLFGYLAFNGPVTVFQNQPIPHGSSSSTVPSAFIAPWWDNIRATTGTQVSWETSGTAPNRTVTFEWRDVVSSGTATKFSFQAKLFEGSELIRFSYGPTAPSGTVSASVGIQNQLSSGIAAMTCTTSVSGSCGYWQFPINQAIELQKPAELSLTSLATRPIVYAGVPFQTAVRIHNKGGSTALATTVRLFLSTDTNLDFQDTLLGESATTNVEPNSSKPLAITGTVPSNRTTGLYYLFGEVDADDAIDEADETNNQIGPIALNVGPASGDLTAVFLTVPSEGAPGTPLNVSARIQNVGNAPVASGFRYTYLLSDNDAISRSDLPLGASLGANALAAGGSTIRNDAVPLPTGIRPGRYWLGLCVDYQADGSPTESVSEISEVNNCVASATPFVLQGADLAVTTTTVSAATLFAPYGAQLEAFGGSGSYSWSLEEGALPQGLTLTEQGALTGHANSAGSYAFVVQVKSDGKTASARLTLQVVQGGLRLALPHQSLPTAIMGSAYRADLIAVGGQPPYRWSVDATTPLPAGIGLSSEGRLEGRALQAKETQFRVEVTDASGAQTGTDLELRVAPPSTLHISTGQLAHGTVGKDYISLLSAAGGTAPYEWTLVQFQALGMGSGGAPSAATDVIPPNLGVTLERNPSGDVVLRGTPSMAGSFALTLKARDAEGFFDARTLLLSVFFEEALSLSTYALPDAFVDDVYSVALRTNERTDGGSTARFELEGGELPPGLVLGSSGTITGYITKPTNVTLPKTYPLLVLVKDASGRIERSSLSIKLRADKELSGCSAVNGPTVFLSLLLGLVVWRRTRMGRRG